MPHASCSGLLALLTHAGAAVQGSLLWEFMATRTWSSPEVRTALLICPTLRLGVRWASSQVCALRVRYPG